MHFLPSFILIITLLAIQFPAEAQETRAQDSTRIEADSDKGQIRFYIDDTLSAILDQDGLRVRKDISYSGTLTDMVAPEYIFPPEKVIDEDVSDDVE